VEKVQALGEGGGAEDAQGTPTQRGGKWYVLLDAAKLVRLALSPSSLLSLQDLEP